MCENKTILQNLPYQSTNYATTFLQKLAVIKKMRSDF